MDTNNQTVNDFLTTFIFPFKYERGDGGEAMPDEIATKLNPVDNKNLGWTIEPYKLDSPENYNEYYYFHPFVREAIFKIEGNSGVEYLTREDYKCLEVEYPTNAEETNTISVDVKSIDLHLFANKIGLLTITTEKCPDDDKTSFNDFLRYNDITRRVYPPFISWRRQNTEKAKYSAGLLPLRMTLSDDKDKKITECFDPIDLKSEKDILYLSKIVKTLLAPFELKDKLHMEMDKNKIYYTPFTDDRMFIVSYYADSRLARIVSQRCRDGYGYENSKDWYRFIFVDGNCLNIANPEMMRELIRKHTYSRWIEDGSLFGMSSYSFVMVGDNGPFCRDVLKQHMKSMYYQIALIVLFQQAMLLKFSEDIQKAMKRFEKNDDFPELKKDASKLHGDFIRFINKYWFIEVTPQEQGIEMYNQWIGLLNVEKLFNEVQREIEELDSYVEAKVEARTNRNLAIITYIGLPIAILSMIFSFWQVYEDRIKKAIPWDWADLLMRGWGITSFKFLLVSIPLVFIIIFAAFFFVLRLRKLFLYLKKWYAK